jgi:multidrug efflux pump subunit AcrB
MVALTLPISLLGAFVVMKLLGFSFNILSLGGLVVSFTVILDNSLVVLENIARLQNEKNRNAIVVGTVQVAKPIVFSTLTFIAIFLPFLMVPGLTSLLFKELVITVAVIVAFSLINALTVIPALYRLFYGEENAADDSQIEHKGLFDRIMDIITGQYSLFLRFVLKKGKIISVLILIIFLGFTGYMWKHIGSEFLPRADDGMVSVRVTLPVGTASTETEKVVKSIESAVKNLPDVESYSTVSGGGIWGSNTIERTNEGTINVHLVPPKLRNLTTIMFVNKYRPDIMKSARYPGAFVRVSQARMRGIRTGGDSDIEA